MKEALARRTPPRFFTTSPVVIGVARDMVRHVLPQVHGHHFRASSKIPSNPFYSFKILVSRRAHFPAAFLACILQISSVLREEVDARDHAPESGYRLTLQKLLARVLVADVTNCVDVDFGLNVLWHLERSVDPVVQPRQALADAEILGSGTH